MSGSDVGSLQTFLAADPTLYPQGLVTNYFGNLTKGAVANFQTRNGLPAVGRVGPMTLPVLNAQMGNGTNTGTAAPIIIGTAVTAANNTAVVSFVTNEDSKAVVYYSTTPLTTYEGTNSVTISGQTAMQDASLRTMHSVTISGLHPNTTYYYMVHTTDQGGNVSVTWPSTFRTN
jgi:peptidoglycan hydrolase-like protein with peptidoglycan-binding domain